jgi:hypothetical protein
MNFRQEVVTGKPWEATGLTLAAFDSKVSALRQLQGPDKQSEES